MTAHTVAIVGGNGQISRLLHPLLVDLGHQPIALVRSEAQRQDLESLGAKVRTLDIENDPEGRWDEAFSGADTIVFAAGGGPDGNIDRKRTVDLGGSLQSIAAAQRLGIRRFIQISAIDVDRPLPEDTAPVWAAYVAAKRDADVALRATDLDWTIVRPGRLIDEPATGKVAAGEDVARGDVTRADVAAVVAALVDTGAAVRAQFNLVGGATPVAEAVAAQSATEV